MRVSGTADDATILSLEAARPARVPDPTPGVGSFLGRYAVLDELGRGGMGVVLRAYDPQLHREVALKVVRAKSSDAEARLIREARAMAQLSHPHVVAVYDVTVDDTALRPQVVLTMEYVAGMTLRQWREVKPRTAAEVLDVFVQAGRGLAAAHREGLLHRDFKPDNVLVGEDGRVRVTDFGLARVEGSRDTLSDSATEGDSVEPADSQLTAVGTVVGTLRYMAPEQHRAKPLTPAADQFAFCVALWEALQGKAPFSGTARELAKAKMQGPPPWPRSRLVPRRVGEAVCRGLSAEPGERFATMDELLTELATVPGSWRARGLAAVAVVAVGGAVWVAASDSASEVCSGAERQLEDIWGQRRAGAIAAAFDEAEIPYAMDVWGRVAPRIDGWAETWTQMHREACEATRVRGEQSSAVLDLRMACLERARQRLDAVVGVLEGGTPSAIANAHELAEGLPSLDRCADVTALQADVPPPPAEEAEAVAVIRSDLAESTALRQAGEPKGALAAAGRAAAAMEALVYEPIQAEVLVELGAALDDAGEYDEAEKRLRKAIELGMRWRQWGVARFAILKLIRVLGYQKARHEEALALKDAALGLSHGSAMLEARARTSIANVLERMGRFGEAEEAHREVLALQREALGDDDHPDLAPARNNLGNVLFATGKYAEAEVEYRAALVARTVTLGEEHPEVAASRNNLGLVLQSQGKYEAAIAEHRAVLEIRRKVLGPDHPDMGASHNNLAMVLQLTKQFGEAEAEYRAALQIWSATLGADHPNLGTVRANFAALLSTTERNEEAEEQYRKALAVQVKALGEEHPAVSSTRHNLATTLRAMGRLDEAEAAFRVVVKNRTTALGRDHPDVAASRANLGNLLLERRRYKESEVELRAALEIRTKKLGADHPDTKHNQENLDALLKAKAAN